MRVSGASAGVKQVQPSNAETGSVNRRLSRCQRISDSGIFRETFSGGCRYAGRLIVMWLRRADDACLRFAVIVSKKTFARSVDRSRAKRLLRESFRLNRHRLQGKVDVILMARRYIGGVKRQAVDEELLRLAREAGILQQER